MTGLDPEWFSSLSGEMNNTHYVIMHEDVLSEDLRKYLHDFRALEHVKFFTCSPSHKTFKCPYSNSLVLLINGMKIEFNGDLSSKEGTSA